jgi:hypothetical protein
VMRPATTSPSSSWPWIWCACLAPCPAARRQEALDHHFIHRAVTPLLHRSGLGLL